MKKEGKSGFDSRSKAKLNNFRFFQSQKDLFNDSNLFKGEFLLKNNTQSFKKWF